MSSWLSAISYIGIIVFDHTPLLAYGETSPCPPLLSPSEITSRQRHLETQCALRSTKKEGQQSNSMNTSHIEWIIQVFALELSVNGGSGWRLYQPLKAAPSVLPHFAPPHHACAYHFSFFERDGRVWALERWSIRPPSTSASRRSSLSHPHYATARVLLSSTATLSNTRRWELIPEGICPSLLPAPSPQPSSLSGGHRNTQMTHRYPLTHAIQTTIQSKPLLGCGSGAPKRGHSLLMWTRLP